MTLSKTFVCQIPWINLPPSELAATIQAKALFEINTDSERNGKYSILLLEEAFSLIELSDGIYKIIDGRKAALLPRSNDILNLLERISNQHAQLHLDIPFPAGGMGYLAYEYAEITRNQRFIEKPDRFGIPFAQFILGNSFIVFSHRDETVFIVGLSYEENPIDLETKLIETRRKIDQAVSHPRMSWIYDSEHCFVEESLNDAEYFESIPLVRKAFRLDQLHQVILSRRKIIHTEAPAILLYKNMRSNNPSPYMYYLDCCYFQIFGTPPSCLIHIEDQTITSEIVSGTRKRGTTNSEDQAIANELHLNEKEKHEHLMLVKQAQIDLFDMCQTSSLELVSDRKVIKYPNYFHLLSKIKCTTKPNINPMLAIKNVFPPASVMGIPRQEAAKVIHAVEPVPRGVYGGSVGYIEPKGAFKFFPAIRGGLKFGDVLLIQAGAGIISDSTIEHELEETNMKLGVLESSILSSSTSNRIVDE